MKKVSGFTLIELMITLAIMSIVIGIAVPSFTDMIQKNQISALSNKFMSELMWTRSEAIKRNQEVVMCRSIDGATCAAAGDWSVGWLVFVNTDGDTTFDAGEVMIRSMQTIPSGFSLTGNGSYSSRVKYRSDGSVSTAGTFTLCDWDAADSDSKQIIISATGRPRRSSALGDCS